MRPALSLRGIARSRLAIGLAVCLMVLPACYLVLTAPALAETWRVDGDLTGKNGKTSKDMSGMACAGGAGFPRRCLVIDDELQAAQVVTLRDGHIEPGALIPLIGDMFDGDPVELDGEGVAFDGRYFYVIGSHGRPRHDRGHGDAAHDQARIEARLVASSRLVRLTYGAARGTISTDPDAPPSTALAQLIAQQPALAPFKDRALEDGGITIEGVAVLHGRLFAGFRGPLLKDDRGDDQAVILSAALGHFFDGAEADATLHRLKLGPGRGVRDLAAYDNGLLVLAGPVQSNNDSYSIYWWDGASDIAKRLADVPDYFSKKAAKNKHGLQEKPEALLPLDRNANGLRVLLLFDGARNGAPRSLRIPYP